MTADRLDPLDRLDRLAKATGCRMGLRLVQYPGDAGRQSLLGQIEIRDHEPGTPWRRRELRHAEALIGGGSFTRRLDDAATALVERVRRSAGLS